MSESLILEEKIKHILGTDFVFEKIIENIFFENRIQLIYLHKSETHRIIIVLQKQKNGEQDMISRISLFKKTVNITTSFRRYEYYAFDLEKKQEVALKKLSILKTKICLTQIFL
jgi:hypothetical protein